MVLGSNNLGKSRYSHLNSHPSASSEAVFSCFGAFWSFLRLLGPIEGMRWGVEARGCTQGMSGRVLGATLSELRGVNLGVNRRVFAKFWCE